MLQESNVTKYKAICDLVVWFTVHNCDESSKKFVENITMKKLCMNFKNFLHPNRSMFKFHLSTLFGVPQILHIVQAAPKWEE